MIYGSTAPTGGGKSYSAMIFICEYLRERLDDHVCTNVAIEMEELVQFMIREYGESFGARERVRILTESEVRRFWLHFGVGFDIPPQEKMEFVDEETGQKTLEVNYKRRTYRKDPETGEEYGHSVLYVLDESDEVFDSKHWAKTSGDLKFYSRHQRKFGDNVYFLCPSWNFLIKDMRVLCHFVWVWENKMQGTFGRIPIAGRYFRGGNTVVGKMWKVREGGVYGGMGEVDRKKMEFKIDPEGIGKTYRTEDGFGVRGSRRKVRGAERAKGLDPKWMIAIAIAILCMIGLAFDALGTKIQNTVDGFSPKPAIAQVHAPASAGPVPLYVKEETNTKTAKHIQAEVKEDPDLRLTGIVPVHGGLEFYWSDRSITTTGDREFQRVIWSGIPGRSRPAGVVWNGKEFRL